MTLADRAGEGGIGPIPGVAARKSLARHVFEHLKAAIVEGRLAEGQRLVESKTAARLGISRTPVREALLLLEREGLVKRRRRGGFTVQGLTREDLEETFGIREVLESYAARLAAQKHVSGDLVPLEGKIDQFQRHLDRGDLAALTEINTAFHDLLYGLSRSPRLIRMIHGLRDPIYRYRRVILRHEGLARRSNADHREMLTRIRQRDADGVERLVRRHIQRGRAAVLRELDGGAAHREEG
jgi:DNA-binding GntR family transcriptional regulator